MSLLFVVPTAGLPAATWTTPQGGTIEGEIIDALGGVIVVRKSEGDLVSLPVVGLRAPEVAAAMDWAAGRDQGTDAQTMGQSEQVLTRKLIAQRPFRAEWGKFSRPELQDQPEPLLYVLLFGGETDKDFRSLAKELSDLYADANSGRKIFEVLQIYDRGGEDNLKTMLGQFHLPWLAVDRQSVDADLWAPYAGKDEPNLVLISASGATISDSYRGTPDFKGPLPALNDLKAIVGQLKAGAAGGRSIDNPFIDENAIAKKVAEFVATGTDVQPRPILLDFRGLTDDEVAAVAGNDYNVMIEIDANGLVDSLSVKGSDDAALQAHLRKAAHLWQFLPMVKGGAAKTVKIQVPLKVPPLEQLRPKAPAEAAAAQ